MLEYNIALNLYCSYCVMVAILKLLNHLPHHEFSKINIFDHKLGMHGLCNHMQQYSKISVV